MRYLLYTSPPSRSRAPSLPPSSLSLPPSLPPSSLPPSLPPLPPLRVLLCLHAVILFVILFSILRVIFLYSILLWFGNTAESDCDSLSSFGTRLLVWNWTVAMQAPPTSHFSLANLLSDAESLADNGECRGRECGRAGVRQELHRGRRISGGDRAPARYHQGERAAAAAAREGRQPSLAL